jgi:hypothetical protein
MLSSIVVLVLLSSSLAFAGEQVKDETVRLRAVRLAFPNATISALAGRTGEQAYPVTDPIRRVIAVVNDALAGNREYQVIGAAAKNEEAAASDVTGAHSASERRQVQMKLYSWRTAKGKALLVAGLSYWQSLAFVERRGSYSRCLRQSASRIYGVHIRPVYSRGSDRR